MAVASARQDRDPIAARLRGLRTAGPWSWVLKSAPSRESISESAWRSPRFLCTWQNTETIKMYHCDQVKVDSSGALRTFPLLYPRLSLEVFSSSQTETLALLDSMWWGGCLPLSHPGCPACKTRLRVGLLPSGRVYVSLCACVVPSGSAVPLGP